MTAAPGPSTAALGPWLLRGHPEALRGEKELKFWPDTKAEVLRIVVRCSKSNTGKNTNCRNSSL